MLKITVISHSILLSGYRDTGEIWRKGYDVKEYDFREKIEVLYMELRPLYKEVHCKSVFLYDFHGKVIEHRTLNCTCHLLNIDTKHNAIVYMFC